MKVALVQFQQAERVVYFLQLAVADVAHEVSEALQRDSCLPTSTWVSC